MSSPTYPWLGRGEEGGICKCSMTNSLKFLTPGDIYQVTNPLLIIPEITPVWKSMDIRFANVPNLGTSSGDKFPPSAQPGVDGV